MSPPLRCAWLTGAAALVGLLPTALAAAPLDVVRDCAAHVPAEISGIKGLDAACPGLEAAIQSLGLDRVLYDGWRDQLNVDSLRNASTLTDLYSAPKPTAGPAVVALSGILKSMAREQASAPKSWWDSFVAWLKTWLQGQDADSLSWLDRWLDRMRQSVTLLNVILYSLIGLVVIAAGWVVANELRAAGLLSRGRARPETAKSASALAPGSPGDSELEPMALPERMAALLRMLVNRLVKTGRLKSERSLTHRELVMRSAFDSESQRAVFAAVAGSAEAILYGTHGVAADRLNSVLREGEMLLAQLPEPASPR